MMSRQGVPAIATVVVFLAFISTFLVIEVLSRMDESLLVINPTPAFHANTMGNLKPYGGGFTYWHPLIPYSYSIDGDGFRKNASRSTPRPDEVIFCLGDSYTFGVSVLDRETYPAHLEQRVNSRFQGRQFKVVNSGMPGVGIEDYYLYYKDKARQMKPSLVVLQYNVYNLRLLADTYRYTFKSQGIPFNPLKHWVREDDIIKFLNKALSHLSWYKRVSEVLADPSPVKKNAANQEMARAVLGDRKYAAAGAINHVLAEDNRALEEKNQAVIEPLWDRYCEVLLRLKQDVERDGGEFLLVMIPHYRQMNSFENAMSARLGRFCRENGIKHVDLTRKFRSLFMDAGVELYCMPHDFHCSPSGNALIAEEIADRMRLDRPDGGPGASGFHGQRAGLSISRGRARETRVRRCRESRPGRERIPRAGGLFLGQRVRAAGRGRFDILSDQREWFDPERGGLPGLSSQEARGAGGCGLFPPRCWAATTVPTPFA